LWKPHVHTCLRHEEVKGVGEQKPKLIMADLLVMRGSPIIIAVWDGGNGVDTVAFAVSPNPPALLIALGGGEDAPVAAFQQDEYVSGWIRRCAEEGAVTLLNIIPPRGLTIPVTLTVDTEWMRKAEEELRET